MAAGPPSDVHGQNSFETGITLSVSRLLHGLQGQRRGVDLALGLPVTQRSIRKPAQTNTGPTECLAANQFRITGHIDCCQSWPDHGGPGKSHPLTVNPLLQVTLKEIHQLPETGKALVLCLLVMKR